MKPGASQPNATARRTAALASFVLAVVLVGSPLPAGAASLDDARSVLRIAPVVERAPSVKRIVKQSVRDYVTKRGMILSQVDRAHGDVDLCVMPRGVAGFLLSLRIQLGADRR